jgi:hypothetical protein
MNNIITKLLEKRGIKDVDELKGGERAKIETWSRIFSREVKVEDISRFIELEISRIEDEWLDTSDKNPFSYLFEWKKNLEAKARIRNYKNLQAVIREPEKNKENLEKYIKKLINN